MTEQPDNIGINHTFLPTVSLFTSMGTLVCCALPALLVTLGAGATLAGIVSTAPWLVALSKYKLWTFGVSGFLILIAGIMQWRARNAPCPADPIQAAACNRLRRISRWIYSLSVVVWLVGFFFAFLAVHIFYQGRCQCDRSDRRSCIRKVGLCCRGSFYFSYAANKF